MRFVHAAPRFPFVLLCTTALLAACGGGQNEDPSLMRWGGDLLGAGSSVVVTDSVTGDVILGGGQLGFTGVAGGDYLGGGRDHVIGGRILGDVRAAGNDVRLSGYVARNVTAAAQRVQITDAATVDGNAYLAGQLVRMEGTVGGFLRAAAQRVILDGTVDGSVDVRARSLHVGPGARINGDLTYRIAEENVVIDPAAQITGSVNALPTGEADGGDGPPIGLFHLLRWLAFLVTGAVMIAIFPRTATAAERALRRRPGASLGLGIAWVILVPIGAAMIALTLVGLPIALLILALHLFLLYIARAVVAVWLGRLLLRNWMRPERGRLIGAFLLGAIVLLLLCLIPIVGTIILFLTTFAGLGALVLAWRGGGAYPEEV